MTDLPEDTVNKVRSLGELPRAIEPKRDLWPDIQARLSVARPLTGTVQQLPLRRRFPSLQVFAAAAMVATLAVGVWIGRSLLPGVTGAVAPPTTTLIKIPPMFGTPTAMDAAYMTDPRYQRDRAALLKGLEAQIAALPQPTRDKVMASLTAIREAKENLEQALGKDPGNALLQELLINTYQDEMRVLTDLHEAGDAGKGI
jgi:hypothetical protein